jgi:hypothetical protein
MNAISLSQLFRQSKWMIRSLVLVFLTLITWLTVVSCDGGGRGTNSTGLSPEVMTNYIFRILKSERTVYGKHVVQRLTEEKVIEASENWQQDRALPLPAQMFTMTAEMSSQDGSFSYGSVSPWSLNPNHLPKTEFEERAIKQVVETGLPYKDYLTKDGKRYFAAIYPDKVVSASCANCHNSHPLHKQRYPDKVFKEGDVMGGIIINLPLDES